jgi:hypothetical protein
MAKIPALNTSTTVKFRANENLQPGGKTAGLEVQKNGARFLAAPHAI